jgi:hypothetical protein
MKFNLILLKTNLNLGYWVIGLPGSQEPRKPDETGKTQRSFQQHPDANHVRKLR